MPKCKICEETYSVRPWSKKKTKERKKKLKICTKCWFQELTGEERHKIAMWYKNN